MINNYFI